MASSRSATSKDLLPFRLISRTAACGVLLVQLIECALDIRDRPDDRCPRKRQRPADIVRLKILILHTRIRFSEMSGTTALRCHAERCRWQRHVDLAIKAPTLEIECRRGAKLVGQGPFDQFSTEALPPSRIDQHRHAGFDPVKPQGSPQPHPSTVTN